MYAPKEQILTCLLYTSLTLNQAKIVNNQDVTVGGGFTYHGSVMAFSQTADVSLKIVDVYKRQSRQRRKNMKEFKAKLQAYAQQTEQQLDCRLPCLLYTSAAPWMPSPIPKATILN